MDFPLVANHVEAASITAAGERGKILLRE
ncbi:not available [Yersinia enterocolitica]|nr:not available [Yersinia enterocolitica]UXD31303.1 not available [Yersinia enterocolitica]